MPGLDHPLVFERGDKLFIVAGVQPFGPDAGAIEEFAFAEGLKTMAPNEHLTWMRGQYVEADTPNANRVMWTSEDLAITSLTPTFMPVTVMHDPRTAVGVIADAKLLTPEKDGVPRSKIETALALWGHRFPDAVEEALHNAKQGTLMQSMECLAPDYSCSECGMNFHKMPGGFERENWCAHLRGEETANASRILRNVVFTGTGLIYGTRGAEGADPKAHLEVFQEEVAEAHARWHHDTTTSRTRRKPTMARIEIEQSEYDRLKADVTAANDRATAAEAKVTEANAAVEKAEADKVKAEQERDEEKGKREQAEETARATTLRDERMSKLGSGFSEKLGEKTKANLTEQAGKLSDEEWTARLDELAEAYGVKPDAEKDKKDEGTDEFSETEIASAQFGGGAPASTDEPSPSERRSVVGGLFK